MTSFPPPPPPPPQASTTCFFHQDRVTGRRCTRCGRPACPDCLRTASVGSHCWECIKASAPPVAVQARRAINAQDLLATKVLIALNIAMFIPTLRSGGAFGRASSDFHNQFGLSGLDLAAGEWYRMLTSGFLHFGLFHVGMNMFILYQLGLTLEAGIGRSRFLAIYFSSLLAGSFGAVLMSPNSLTAGASGAVFGMAAAATVGMSRRGISFAATGWGPMLLINLIFTFTMPGVSVGGHVGGLLAGVVLGYLMLDPRIGGTRPKLGYATAALIALVAIVGAYVSVNEKFGTCRAVPNSIQYECDKF